MSEKPPPYLSQLSPFIRSEGEVAFTFAGEEIRLDLRHKHERAYAAKLLLGALYPQSDIDSFLFKRFIRPGDTVLDAGANIGFTALECLAAGAKSVVAVEPLPELFARLKRLEGSRIFPVEKAISNDAGEAEFFISSTHNQGSSLKQEMIKIFPKIFGAAPRKVPVRLTTIDRLAAEFGYFDVWKIDIEGAEIDALKGAARTLAEQPPRVIIAEIYGAFWKGFWEAVRPTHPFAYRAFIQRDNYALSLRDPKEAVGDDVYQTSPMYVFLSQPL